MRTREVTVREARIVLVTICESLTCPNAGETRTPGQEGILMGFQSRLSLAAWFDVPTCLTTWTIDQLPGLLRPEIPPPTL